MDNNSQNQNKKNVYKIRQTRSSKKSVYRPDAIVREPVNENKAVKPEKNTAQKKPVSNRSRNTDRNKVPKQPIQANGKAATQDNIIDKEHINAAASTSKAPSVNKSPAKRKVRQHRKSDLIKPTDIIRVKGSYDKIFLVLVIILTLFGIIMDFSASYAYAFSSTGDSLFFVKRQILYAAVGFAAMILAMRFDYKWLRKVTVPVYISTIVLLIAVLGYGVASGVAQRWIFIGSISIQPSEIMKFSLVIMLALYVARNQDRITNYRNFKQSSVYGMFIPLIIIAIPCGLVALESHFSGTIIIFAIGLVVLFASGARSGWFVAAAGGAAAVLVPFILISSYANERVDMWIHPENYSPTGKIWQTLQGLYAIGSGGIFGVGLGNSRQKHLYVSQPQNDFVFSIICEELGFAGAILVIILFMLLIWRGFVIAMKAPDTFSSLVVIGLISKVAIQTILNIAVVTNTIPNTGISLPFFSYGGTALLMQLGEMGIILSISRYSYQRREDITDLATI